MKVIIICNNWFLYICINLFINSIFSFRNFSYIFALPQSHVFKVEHKVQRGSRPCFFVVGSCMMAYKPNNPEYWPICSTAQQACGLSSGNSGADMAQLRDGNKFATNSLLHATNLQVRRESTKEPRGGMERNVKRKPVTAILICIFSYLFVSFHQNFLMIF